MSFRKNSLSPALSTLSLGLLAILGIIAASCSSDSQSAGNDPLAETPALVVFAAASDVGLGEVRIPLVIQMIDGTRFDDAADRLEVTYKSPDAPDGSNPKAARLVRDLTWRKWPIQGGVYTATMTFDEVGFWEVTVRLVDDDGTLPARSGVLVKSGTDAPDIGDVAPLTATKTTPPDGNLRSNTIAPTPDPDLYAISFDEAVATRLPTVISFSTPAYCQSGTCGPQTEVLSHLDETYKGRANFIHVEIFDNPAEMLATGDPSLGIEAPVIHDWGFHTEPWTFVVDGAGVVVGRFEAFTTAAEIEEALVPLLAGG